MAGQDNPLLITDTDIAGVLKRVYESYRMNAFPIATPLLAQLKKGKGGGPENMRWGGEGVFWDVVLTRPVGMSASQLGYFPPNAKAVEKQASVGIKRTYVSRQIDLLSIQGTSENVAAYIPLARKIIREALDAARLGQQEVLHGDGRAIKALLVSTADTTHFVADSPYGVAASGRGGLLLDRGMFISVRAGAAGAIRGTATITAVTNSGDQVTVTLDTAIAAMAAGDSVRAAATATDDSMDNYPNGLINLSNRGGSFNSLHGLSAATDSRWDSTRLVAGTDTPDAAQPSEMDLFELSQRLAGVSGKDATVTPDEFLCQTTPGIRKKLAESFLGQRSLRPEDFRPIEGGFKAIEIFGISVLADFWTPAGTVYLIHKPSLAWVDRMDWVKVAYEGAGPWRFIPGRDGYEVNFGSYWNTAVLNRIGLGLITGYTDTVRYDHVK